MNSLEGKREQFRKYLERCGVIDSLSNALIKLYEETNKPEDAVRFVRKYMCESCPDELEYEALKADYHQAIITIQSVEEELERLRGNLKRSPSEITTLLKDGFKKLQDDDDCISLLKKYLTDDVFEELKEVTTKYGGTLLDIVQSGFEQHSSKVGIYAADAESFSSFKSLFDPIILEYHNAVEETDGGRLTKELDWGDSETVKDLDVEGNYIVCTKMTLSRNLDEYPYFMKLTEEQFKEIEEKIKNTVNGLDENLTGSYTSIREISPENQSKMIANNILFSKNNETLKTAGCYRFWPTGRGIFYNKTQNFIVWVNAEDHLEIISTAKCGDIGDVYRRLVKGAVQLQSQLKFQVHSRYGYLTADPRKMGTAFFINIHIKLPNLRKNLDKLKDLCENMDLIYDFVAGGKENEVLKISNKTVMGPTEFKLVKDFQENVQKIIDAENEMES